MERTSTLQGFRVGIKYVTKRNKVSFTIAGAKLMGVKYVVSDLFQAFTYRCYGNLVSAGKPP